MLTAMEDDAGVSKLVELMFGKKSTIPEETVADSSIPSSLLTEDFSKKFADVLSMRKRIVLCKWHGYDDLFHQMSSHEMYLKFVISSCLCEHECIQNIFDSFISVCALVIHWSEKTLEITGLNFRDLNPDIFMVFYRNVLKSSFLTGRGFYPFVEYIQGHRYLKWNCDKNELDLSRDPTSSAFLEQDINEYIMKELNRYRSLHEVPDERESEIKVTTLSLVQEVLSKTSVELPTIPSEPDVVITLVASNEKEIAGKAGRKRKVEETLTNETSHGNSGSNSDCKIDYFSDRQDNIEWYENIVQVVTIINHTKNSGQEYANSQIREEADGIVDKLKTTVKSLIEVLDEDE